MSYDQFLLIVAANTVSSWALYPEITGSCPAGHFLNTTSLVCERCNWFRYNDGTMNSCQVCSGQGIGESETKATKCVTFCSWPFEYQYEDNYNPITTCVNDGGLCTTFVSNSVLDVECRCPSGSGDYSMDLSGAPATIHLLLL